MIIDCAHYRDGRRQSDTPMTLDVAATTCREEGFIWLGLFEPSAAELDEVRQCFGLHELAVKDAETFHLRPKIEQYERCRGPGDPAHRPLRRRAGGGRLRRDQHLRVLHLRHHRPAGRGQRAARRPAAARGAPRAAAAGPASTLWAILDQVVDGYAPVVAELERDIEQVEGTVFAGEVAPTERIYFLRREVTNFHRAVHPLLAVLAAVERTARDSDLLPYLRDVRDHLLLVNEEVSAQRDLLATILEANMAVITVEQTRVSVRQSATMERLTVLATVFLPLTFVTGFFGQNFGWLLGHISGFTAFVVLRHRGHGGPPGPALPLAAVHPAPTGARRRRAVTRTLRSGAGAVAPVRSGARSGSLVRVPTA